jgi:hypothetical protein
MVREKGNGGNEHAGTIERQPRCFQAESGVSGGANA